MKVKVLKSFRSIEDFSKEFAVGEIIELSKERADRVIGIGYAEKAEPAQSKLDLDSNVDTEPLPTETATPKRYRRKE